MKEGILKKIIAVFAIFTTAVIIVSYGVLTTYYSGYLAYFGVNIKYIDFWPHLSDFVLLAAPIIMVLIICGTLTAFIFLFFNWLGHLIQSKSKKIFIQQLGKSLIREQGFNITATVLTIFIATFTLIYVNQLNIGGERAAKQTEFVRVGQDGPKIDLIIYENNGIAIVKSYDKQTKAFDTSYKTIDFTGQTYERVTIERN